MRRTPLWMCINILPILTNVDFIYSSEVFEGTAKIDCQQKTNSGTSYMGESNTTVEGIPCQRWSDTQPHNHSFTDVGDHNFCRNPTGDSKVWCYTMNPEVRWQECSIPFCPMPKHFGCQQKSTSGRDYVGEANTTFDGIPCQRRSDKQLHDHEFTM